MPNKQFKAPNYPNKPSTNPNKHTLLVHKTPNQSPTPPKLEVDIVLNGKSYKKRLQNNPLVILRITVVAEVACETQGAERAIA